MNEVIPKPNLSNTENILSGKYRYPLRVVQFFDEKSIENIYIRDDPRSPLVRQPRIVVISNVSPLLAE